MVQLPHLQAPHLLNQRPWPGLHQLLLAAAATVAALRQPVAVKVAPRRPVVVTVVPRRPMVIQILLQQLLLLILPMVINLLRWPDFTAVSER